MQESHNRRSNHERTQATRKALIDAARALFLEHGYADTGTPQIVAAAKVTRGALYHHFVDKADLFYAEATDAADEVAAAINAKSTAQKSALKSLKAGARAYFDAITDQGRARLLLLEAPVVLTPTQVSELNDRAGTDELRAGLEVAMPQHSRKAASMAALTAIVSAAFDRAALDIANGAAAKPYYTAIGLLLEGLVANDAH